MSKIHAPAVLTFNRKEKAVLFVSAALVGIVVTATAQRLAYQNGRLDAAREIHRIIVDTLND